MSVVVSEYIGHKLAECLSNDITIELAICPQEISNMEKSNLTMLLMFASSLIIIAAVLFLRGLLIRFEMNRHIKNLERKQVFQVKFFFLIRLFAKIDGLF